MGIVDYSLLSDPRSKSTLRFLEWCHSLGAGGVQVGLDSLADDYVDTVHRRSEALRMYLEVIAELPKAGDASQFERLVVAAKRAGAVAMRTACLSGRRYETLSSLAEWTRFVEDSKARMRLAVRIVEKHRMPLGIENHKDWTLEELVALMKDYSSEYVGVCLDFGNNLALLDDPTECVELLAPYAVSTHVKDMAVEECEEGFLLSEVPLGDGGLDLRRMVETIRKARPAVKFSLEMITRDPLRIPCLTDKYWATFPERNGKYLARALRWVRAHRTPKALPRVTGLDAAVRQLREEENVRKCLAFASDQLGLAVG